MIYSGICGSDVHNVALAGTPGAFGHEWVGRVTRIGSGVEGFAVGDRVIGAVGTACGKCAPCEAGLTEHCTLVIVEGTYTDAEAPAYGAFSTTMLAPQRRVMKALEALTDEQAAFIEPVAVVFHAVKRTAQPLGATVVVQGAGPIGLLIAQQSRAAGAGSVLIVEPNEQRRAVATELGFAEVFAPGEAAQARLMTLSNGLGADVVYECTGVARLVQPAAQLVRRGGTLSLVGFAPEPSEVHTADWLMRELRVLASVIYNHEDFTGAMRAVAQGAITVEPLHTSTIGLDELGAMIDELHSGATAQAKVLLAPRA